VPKPPLPQTLAISAFVIGGGFLAGVLTDRAAQRAGLSGVLTVASTAVVSGAFLRWLRVRRR
jgi:hypothetical protein